VAIEEGLTYVPPSDPPVVASDDPEGIAIAAGFSTGAAEETWDLDHRTSEQIDESELNALIRAAIRADAATSQLADRVRIAVVGSTVVIRGTVDDLEDGDAIAAVVEQVEGVREVRDETEVAALG
jgi:osmotically-inducible protein OsmY